jgi:chromate transport protein ChrA
MDTRDRWAKILTITGSIAVIVGALDPLEGSLLILPGSILTAVAAYLGKEEKGILRYRVWVFFMIAFGVASLWGLSAVGGIGRPGDLSWWWGLLLVPYLIGLPLALWGPKLSRWLYFAGLVPGFWYLAIAIMLLKKSQGPPTEYAIIAALAAVSLIIIGGCGWRLSRKN